ncbi:hypothetical protein [Thalassotalea agarivorans]|uniref:Uncharacterized protein n=1 Tax=Thalassotalea agarivorans TaxID=349064 RepID=A0A1I0AWF0_THASX|nr:hypothetical protein [Thalassotalea agarivorans]SES98103.1 hypothetical protein SAMN05660429_00824 [Thalassotalea agarivorans]
MSQEAQDELVNQIYNHAAVLMKNGKSRDDIVHSLVEQGVDTESANFVVSDLEKVRKQQKFEASKKNIGIGALWCLGGLAVTGATYSAASGGGTYVVAYGAVVIGAVQFLIGLVQYSANKPN